MTYPRKRPLGRQSFVQFWQQPTTEQTQRAVDPEITIDRQQLQRCLNRLESFSGE